MWSKGTWARGGGLIRQSMGPISSWCNGLLISSTRLETSIIHFSTSSAITINPWKMCRIKKSTPLPAVYCIEPLDAISHGLPRWSRDKVLSSRPKDRRFEPGWGQCNFSGRKSSDHKYSGRTLNRVFRIWHFRHVKQTRAEKTGLWANFKRRIHILVIPEFLPRRLFHTWLCHTAIWKQRENSSRENEENSRWKEHLNIRSITEKFRRSQMSFSIRTG